MGKGLEPFTPFKPFTAAKSLVSRVKAFFSTLHRRRKWAKLKGPEGEGLHFHLRSVQEDFRKDGSSGLSMLNLLPRFVCTFLSVPDGRGSPNRPILANRSPHVTEFMT